jgi:hypothetical protein
MKKHPFINTIMLILLSQSEQGISALDLQKHIFFFGQFTHEEYVSMDATSLRKLLQRGATLTYLCLHGNINY